MGRGLNLAEVIRPTLGDLTRDFVSVADLVGHGVPLQWYEAVAIVQQLCEVLRRDAQSGSLSVPEPGDIQLTSTGDVVLTAPGPANENTIKRLGLTLSALLESSVAPAELRLFVSQTTFEVPVYTSVEEFSKGLAYFERPARWDTLRSVYDRAKTAIASGPPKRTDAFSLASLDESRKPKPEPDALLERKRRLMRLAVVAMVAVLAGLGGVLWVKSASGREATSTFSSVATSAKSVVTDQLKSGLAVGRDLVARTGLVEPAPVTVATPVPTEPSVPEEKPPPRRRNPAPARGDLSVSVPVLKSAVEPPAAVAAEPPPAPSLPTAVAPDPRVYSGADDDVEPPIVVYPPLPKTPPPGTGVEELGVIELIVGETGQVETVRLLTWPGSFHDRMILSAAKAWRFKPAQKDGHAVKFRQRIRLTH